MGCGASKNDVIKSSTSSPEESKLTEKSNVGILNGSKLNNIESLNSTSSVRSESSTIPANDFYQNNLSGDLEEQLKPLLVEESLPPLKPPRTSKFDCEDNTAQMDKKLNRPEPIAFEVPADNDEEKDDSGSLIKRHPPRRLRKTIEEQTNESLSLTQEALEEKVLMANERRTQALYQRVASARQKSARAVSRIRDKSMIGSENYANPFEEDSNTSTQM